MNLVNLSGIAAREKLMRGEISAYNLMEAYLDQINKMDKQIQAWSFLDHHYALNLAKAADEYREQGKGEEEESAEETLLLPP